jgi:hypothetical protein
MDEMADIKNQTITQSGDVITEAVLTVPAANPVEALDRACNLMDRASELTGVVYAIETYTVEMVEGNGIGLWYEVTVK